MENKSHKCIAVTYNMYVTEDGEKVVKDVADASNPYRFISGFGSTLDALENALVELNEGDDFEVVISKDDAFGDYNDELVIELPKEQFEFDGKLAVELGQVVPLRDEHGNIYNATVQEVKDDVLVLDMNHPFAGYDLIFEGKLLGSHEATEKELNDYLNHMTGNGCGCGHCGGDDCDDGCCSSGGHSDCCCGHH